MPEMTVKQRKAAEYELLKNNFFLKHVSGKFLLSSVLSMVFLYAGSLIDTLIVGKFLGEDGLSAMSLVSPVYLVYYTVGALIGIGASITASRYLGGNDTEQYRRVFTCATALMTVLTALMTAAGYLLLDPISAALSGGSVTEQTALVRNYLLYYIPGGGFNLLSYIPMYFLKTDGRPKVSSRLFFLSAAINVALSYVLIHPRMGNMGIGGASLATTVSLGLSAMLGFVFLLKGPTQLGFEKNALSAPRILEICRAGVPNSLSNLLESARILLINMLLLHIGAAALLPCYTVVRNISDLLFAVITGIASAFTPMIGVFYGERDFVNERSVIRLSLKVGLSIMIPLVLLVCVIPDPLFRLFGVSDAVLIAQGRTALPLACAGLIFAYTVNFYIGYLTAIRREKTAALLVALRLFLVLAVFAVPLAVLFGAPGIWASLSLAELVTLGIFCLIRGAVRRRDPGIDRYFLDTSLERDADITFSVKNDIADIVAAAEKVSDYCDTAGLDPVRAMKAGNAIEEVLTILIRYCLGEDKENYVDVRVCKLEKEVMLRFRYIGKSFDPVSFYHENLGNEEMEEDLLGVRIIEKGANLIRFSQLLGANTLMIIF